MLLAMLLLMSAPQATPAPAPAGIDLSNGPVTTTNVAVQLALDAKGRVVACKGGTGGTASQAACKGFTKGRVVASPLLRGGKPVKGKMTVSTTTVISAD